MKIAKKFNEELKMAKLEKEELIVRLDESNKKNEFLRNQFSSQDEKMKSLEQKLAKAEAKLENLSNTKLVVDNRSISVSVPHPVKPKDKIYIPPFKRNHKENAYVARLDKGKSFDVYAEISKLVSKPSIRVHKKYIFVPTYHLCGVVGHIRLNCSLLRQKPKSDTRSAVRNTDVPKAVFGSCKSISRKYFIFRKCYFPERKMFSCVWLPQNSFYGKLIPVFGSFKHFYRKCFTCPIFHTLP